MNKKHMLIRFTHTFGSNDTNIIASIVKLSPITTNLKLTIKSRHPCITVHFVHVFYFSSQLVSRDGGVSTCEVVTESIMYEGILVLCLRRTSIYINLGHAQYECIYYIFHIQGHNSNQSYNIIHTYIHTYTHCRYITYTLTTIIYI